MLGCLLYSAGIGYWMVKKLDGFLAHGGLRPYWNEEEGEVSGTVYQTQEFQREKEDWELEVDHIPWGNLRTR